jgi:hypothetical protein
LTSFTTLGIVITTSAHKGGQYMAAKKKTTKKPAKKKAAKKAAKKR